MKRARACIECGCTEKHACPGGCAWYSLRPPLCTACYVARAMAPLGALRAALQRMGLTTGVTLGSVTIEGAPRAPKNETGE